MIDFNAMLRDMETGLSGPKFPENADFSGAEKRQPESQTIDNKHFSGISGISGDETAGLSSGNFHEPQARVRAGGGVRARGPLAEAPEMPETPEMLAPAGACLSGSSSTKPEKPEKREAVASPPSIPLPVVDGLALWRAGLNRLVTVDPERSSHTAGYRYGEWPQVYERAIAFLDQFGAQAEALGWTASRLFGVHPEVGVVRVDCCGALVLPIGGPVRAITATEISFGHLTYREKLGQVKGSPIWMFGTNEGQN